ncbi:EAL domain-containing protein [Psychromonas sp. GE-S-Ul-11]|uniref:sensor domain-containing protein n=1 Tax=Psychromonas sp. GE-S-Ul-11 TaxID=3241170 RepID=UPI00390CA425
MQVNIDQLHTAIWIYDIDAYAIIWANTAALLLWDSTSIDDLAQRDFKIGQSDAINETIEQYRRAFKENKVVQENWFFSPKGNETEALCQFSGVTLEDGRLAMLVEATPTLAHTTMQFKSATIISLYNLNGEFLSANSPFAKKFSSTTTHLKDLCCDHQDALNLLQAIDKEEKFESDILMKTCYGDNWFRVIANRIKNQDDSTHILINQYDIHESKIVEQNLRQQAWADPLTNLVNRRGLIDTLKPMFEKQTPFTLLYIDLDGFKMVNDSLGHRQGDEILVKVSERLKEHKQKGDILCRFGGDEFIFIIENGSSQSDISTTLRCQAIIDSLSEPYQSFLSRELLLSASIGVADYPNDAQSYEQIIAYADAAMYHAKKLGKKQWVQYQTGMENSQKRLSVIAQKLSFALANNELYLHYQPVLDCSTGKIVSFEALLRWYNDELGFVSPEEAISVAEEVGLIYEIETWVLDQALHDLLTLKDLFHPSITMAVNLSGLHLVNPNLVDTILYMLDKHDLQAQDLILELTESVLLTDVNHSNSPINTLASHQIKVSIDDFGTGYSSLAYLHTIPATTVKVDKTFLENINSTLTLECIQRLVTDLSMNSLIEGIETEEQAELLNSLGYRLQQGYYHGRPQPLSYYLSADTQRQSEVSD